MSCTFPTHIIEDTIAFHGHSCPGLAIGIRASELAFRELGTPEETNMVAIAETDMCGVDAIQFLTDCTLGKGNFMHRDFGKMAFSFFDRNTGKGFRALLNPETAPTSTWNLACSWAGKAREPPRQPNSSASRRSRRYSRNGSWQWTSTTCSMSLGHRTARHAPHASWQA